LYKEFWRRHLEYWHPHINIKYISDYLNPVLQKKYLPVLQQARLAAEPVLQKSEDFIIHLVKRLAAKADEPANLLLRLTHSELLGYFAHKTLPKKYELSKRKGRIVFFHDGRTETVFVGKDVGAIEKFFRGDISKSEVRGTPAFPGKVCGKVKVILHPKHFKNFKKDKILVTGATRPDFLPIMYKAAAFITDSGGILSHAAITAREMKKPCVIGTKTATKVFKDGDLVEVDANKGIVRKLSK